MWTSKGEGLLWIGSYSRTNPLDFFDFFGLQWWSKPTLAYRTPQCVMACHHGSTVLTHQSPAQACTYRECRRDHHIPMQIQGYISTRKTIYDLLVLRSVFIKSEEPDQYLPAPRPLNWATHSVTSPSPVASRKSNWQNITSRQKHCLGGQFGIVSVGRGPHWWSGGYADPSHGQRAQGPGP